MLLITKVPKAGPKSLSQRFVFFGLEYFLSETKMTELRMSQEVWSSTRARKLSRIE